MAALADLPNEIFRTILEELAAADLQTLIICQRTSKHFRAAATDILKGVGQVRSRLPAEIPPLLQERFDVLINTNKVFSAKHACSLNGDATLPFRRLRFAMDPAVRAARLGADASWRGLSLARPPITRLDVVRRFSWSDNSSPDTVSFAQVDLDAGGGGGVLTAGLFYDLLCTPAATAPENHNGLTCVWVLMPGRALRSFDVMWEHGRFLPDNEDMVDVASPEAARSAVLLVSGFHDGRRGPPKLRDGRAFKSWDDWVPERIGDEEPKLLSWQGPTWPYPGWRRTDDS
ncbi:hypothetical protein GGR56DRAFT_52932 [Xylariaceae sp. FL0804]|nr:hypothetical protein GGR56DRAFT_52932 [Xylariaceae sp. FL0804]